MHTVQIPPREKILSDSQWACPQSQPRSHEQAMPAEAAHPCGEVSA